MTTVLLYALGVLLLVLGVAVSIGLHEVGHLVLGKAFRVKVTQYFVGFGRTVWSRRRGETEYGLKAVPLGGYVKLVGMLPPAGDQHPGRVRKSNTGLFAQLVSDARAAEYESVEPEDEPRLFYRLPWWKKVLVMSGGPAVNLVLAFLLFGGVWMLHGVAEPTLKVDQVSDCVVAASAGDRPCTDADPVAPAKKAGLEHGDRIVSLNGQRVSSWAEFTDMVRANRDGEARIVYRRDGQRRTTTTNTMISSRQVLDDPSRFTDVGFLGVAPQTVLDKKGPVYVVTQMGEDTWRTVEAVGTLPAKLVDVGKVVLGLQERDSQSPMSVVGASRVAGEVTSERAFPVGDRLASVVLLLGAVNLFVGMFNFVPLLPLDGGHLAGALWEGLRRGVARVLRRPDPGYVDVAKLLPIAYAMAGVLLVMTVVLVYADIVAPVPLR